jgi:Big-like domain-containing protein
MTVRLHIKYGLLGALVGALASASGGCADSSTKTALLGQPKILQVLVLDPTDTTDPDGSNLTLTYGVHPDINPCNAIGVDNNCVAPDDNGVLQPIDGQKCDLNAGSPTFHHCVDETTGKQPIAGNATINGARVRFVVGDLLDGTTLEKFACACQGSTLATATPTNCPDDASSWTSNPKNCSVCGDNAASASNESGQCLDTDANGVPDISALLAGVGHFDCPPGLTGTAGDTRLGDGFYYPSGDQDPWPNNTGVGYNGLGPAIVLLPSFPLPASTDCTVSISSSVKDQHGASLQATTDPVTFHTENLKIATTGTSPAKNAKDVDPCKAEVDVAFNAPIAGTSATATNVTLTPAVAGATVSAVKSNVIGIKLPQPTGCGDTGTPALTPNTDYTVTVTTNVTDTYGVKLPAQVTYKFSVGDVSM